jgi:hypothetical protein
MGRRESELMIAKVILALTDLTDAILQVFVTEPSYVESSLSDKDNEVRLALQKSRINITSKLDAR